MDKKYLFKYFFILVILFSNQLIGKNLNSSHVGIVEHFSTLDETQKFLSMRVLFNKGVFFLSNDRVEEAIVLFEKTKKKFPNESLLNQAIGYYKLNKVDKAKEYFIKLYSDKKLVPKKLYIKINSSYYLYLITKEIRYLESISSDYIRFKPKDDYTKELVVDTYIILKQYDKAKEVINSQKHSSFLKKALLNIKLERYKEANNNFAKAEEEIVYEKDRLNFLWFKIFAYLKMNKGDKVDEMIKEFRKENLTEYRPQNSFPLKFRFNNKTDEIVSSFNELALSDSEQIDVLFYFAPFLFSDEKEIFFDNSSGFLFKQDTKISNLEEMVSYNMKLLDIISVDPVVRINKLKNILPDEKAKSYMFYNIGLAYAHILDYQNAYKYFYKAFNQNPGNHLYAAFTKLSAYRSGKKLKDEKYITSVINDKSGLYADVSLVIEKLFFQKKKGVFVNTKSQLRGSEFYDALVFFTYYRDGETPIWKNIFKKQKSNQVVKILKLLTVDESSSYKKIANFQNNVLMVEGKDYLSGPFIVQTLYIKYLRNLGLYNQANINNIDVGGLSVERLQAIALLYDLNFNESKKIFEYLQEEYLLEDKDTLYYLMASQIESNEYDSAILTLGLIKSLYEDSDSEFLTGLELLQENKLNGLSGYFKSKYKSSIIDYELKNLDEMMLEL